MMNPAAPNDSSGKAPIRRAAGAPLTLRALLIGIMLIPLMCLWVEYTEIVAQGTDLAAMSLIIAVVFALFCLLLLNFALKRYLPRLAFSQAELMYIYIMQTCSIGISGIGMMQFLSTFIGDIYHYATPENQWKIKLLPLVKPWLLPERSVTKGFFDGNTTFWTAKNIAGWMAPIITWSMFICVLLGVMVCLNVLIRHRWAEEERLSFPITQLPLEISKGGWSGELFTNRLLWIGILIPVVLECLASLNYLYPSIPFLPIKPSDPRLDLTPLFNTPPWNGMGTIQLSFYPLVIGLTYFLPLDVSFSLWFFFLFARFENVAATALGYHSPGAPPSQAEMPYVGQQSAGAFIMVALFALYGIRKHLRDAAVSLFSRKRRQELSADAEGIPYSLALVLAVVGFAALTLFGWAIGMAWWIPVIYFILYYFYVITFTRMRAEAGLPWGFGPDMNVHSMMKSAFGTASMSPQSQVSFNMLLWGDMDMRTCQMPNQLEAMQIGESTGMNRRHIIYAILVAIVVGTISSWGAILTVYYQYGASSAKVNSWRTSVGQTPWSYMQNWMDNAKQPNIPRMEGVVVGMLGVAVLYYMRSQFNWWPFHPIGYALSGTFTMGWLWCATLIGWALKALITRYGGMNSYRAYIPFFIGLILGDYITGSLWALFGSIMGIPTYRCFPI